MTEIEEILTAANNLADQGKKPTIALIKAKLSHAMPLITIISVLKTWQHQPNYQAQSVEHKVDNKPPTNEAPLTKEEIELMINKALAPIQNELSQLKALLRKTE